MRWPGWPRRRASTSALPASLVLVAASALIGLIGGWGGGLLLALAENSSPRRRGGAKDGSPSLASPWLPFLRGPGLVADVSQGVPIFWLGGVLVVLLSVGLGVLPPGGIAGPTLPAFGAPAYLDLLRAQPAVVLSDLLGHLTLPALTLALAGLATRLRLVATALPVEFGAPHARVALAGDAAGPARYRGRRGGEPGAPGGGARPGRVSVRLARTGTAGRPRGGVGRSAPAAAARGRVVIGHAWSRFRAQRGAMIALAILAAIVLLSVLAPLIAPQDPADPVGFDPLAANRPPDLSWTYLLGADGRGRSVLAVLLWGGRTTLVIGVGAALLAALTGLAFGALACWRDGVLDPLVSWLMDVCGAAPALPALLLLSSRLGGVPAGPIAVVLIATGWVAPARLTRAAVRAALSAPYVEAARAAGVGGPRLLYAHLLPAALAPVAAWTAAGAAAFVALEAGLDFLGLGLPSGTTSWGVALTGALEAVAAGNWWWITFGGVTLALSTLALAWLAHGIARAFDPTTSLAPAARPRAAPAGANSDTTADADLSLLRAIWGSGRGTVGRRERAPAPPGWARPTVAVGGSLLLLLLLGLGSRYHDVRPGPRPDLLLRAAASYAAQRGQSAAYIATATYAALGDAGPGTRGLPWAAYSSCPAPLRGDRCARADVQLWFSAGSGRAQSEGVSYVCTPRLTWGINPMAGLAATTPVPCGPLGPAMGGLGATAGMVQRLLPADATTAARARLAGQDIVAGRPCWVVALPGGGQVCIDAARGLALRVERPDRAGRPAALFLVTGISFGLDLAPQIFANPIPGGRGPLINGLSQPLLDIQAADDVPLFSALVPRVIPPGLIAQTPTYDSFYDETRGYAPQDRVRQAYADRQGRVALVLLETVPDSAWDVTPPRSQARALTLSGQRLLAWPGHGDQAALVRVESSGTAALVSSRTLSLRTLERVAAGLR